MMAITGRVICELLARGTCRRAKGQLCPEAGWQRNLASTVCGVQACFGCGLRRHQRARDSSSVERIVECGAAAFPDTRPTPSAEQPGPNGALARNFWPWLNFNGPVDRPPTAQHLQYRAADWGSHVLLPSTQSASEINTVNPFSPHYPPSFRLSRRHHDLFTTWPPTAVSALPYMS
jgi:hypothetical protein